MKRLLLPFVFLLLGDPLSSCGPDYTTGEDFRFWLLQPQLAETTALRAFSFTTEYLNSCSFDDIQSIPDEANVREWQAIVGPTVSDSSIFVILSGMEPDAYFKEEEQLRKQNTFLRKLVELQQGWPEYIAFAKRCEALNNAPDPWGFAEHDGDGITIAWKEGMRLLKKAKNEQLKARLAYQLIRLAHYGNLPINEAERLYITNLLPLKGRTWLESSAAFYIASMKPLPQRDLAYADIFDRATDKQFRMVQLFLSRDVDSYMPIATTDRQRANLLVMRDLQHPGRALDDLERIAQLDPGNRHLPMLLTREVNKLEDWLLTPTLTEYPPAIRLWDSYSSDDPPISQEEITRVDLAYLNKVKAFIHQIIPAADLDQRPLLQLMNGHLSFVAGDLDQCRNILANVVDDASASSLVRMQAHVDRILADVLSSQRLTDRTRNEILQLIAVAHSEPESQERDMLLSQLHLFLGKKLIERGEVPEGLFLIARTTRQYGNTTPYYYSLNARTLAFDIAKPADYDRMIALLDKAGKTDFERYLTGTEDLTDGWADTQETFKYNELSREKLLDYKATWYMNSDRLEEAVATFKLIPDEFWTGYPYVLFDGDDPFVANVEDPHNYEKRDGGRYTKRTIAERMLALKKEAAKNPKKRALNNYLLGNAYYNASWHGKYWIMSRIGWSTWEMSQWRDREDNGPGDDDYFGNQRAKEHYEIAFKTAKDPVLKAMACRMLGECEWNWLAYSGEGGLDEWENPWKEKLSDAKSQEAYRAIEECVGYADFVARFK